MFLIPPIMFISEFSTNTNKTMSIIRFEIVNVIIKVKIKSKALYFTLSYIRSDNKS